VFPTEPPTPGHRLYADPRVICTPHAVGLTARWNEQVFHALARDVQIVLDGGLPANVLNPEALTGSVDRLPRSIR
jgi:D-3-phosphoglycerate dehydrogenase / 2-oxoglutarate reductase